MIGFIFVLFLMVCVGFFYYYLLMFFNIFFIGLFLFGYLGGFGI